MSKYVISSKLKYGLAVDEEKDSAIAENICSLLLKTTGTFKSSSIQSLAKKKEPSFVKCYKNPSYASFTDTVEDVIFVGVLDNYNMNTRSILTKNHMKTIETFLKGKQCVPVFPDFSKFNYEQIEYANHIRCLAFAREWEALFNECNENLMYEDYVMYNEAFYEKIKQIADKEDDIIIMDPELWLLPRYLTGFRTTVAFMIPILRIDFFRCLHKDTEILSSLLQAKLVFQNEYESKTFSRVCAIMIPNFDTNILQTQVLQISTNMKIIDEIKNKELNENVLRIKNQHNGKKIIVTMLNSIDNRTSENILVAFNKLIKTENCVLIQIEPHNSQLSFDKRVGMIRGVNFITTTSGAENIVITTPRSDLEYYSILAAANMGVFLFDHSVVNKVCCDFVAINKAPVILSSSAYSLVQALTVNPNDINALLSKMKDGLLLEEDEETHAKNREKLTQNDVSSFFERIKSPVASSTIVHIPRELDVPCILSAFQSAHKRVVVLDYDGSLTAIVEEPSHARPALEIIGLLEHLTQIKNLTVVIATGRSKEEADKWFDNKKIDLYAEHGACFRKNGRWIMRDIDLSWKDAARKIINEYVACTPNTRIEEKNTAIVFHYRNADSIYKDEQAERCRKTLVQTLGDKADVKAGKCIIEINSKDIGKDFVIKQYENYDFALCVGDDITDEKMFGTNGFISVVVGKKKSRAEYCVNTPTELRKFLKELC